MTKYISALILFLLFSFAEAKAQNCMANAEWTFNPPPVNGMFELNTTVEVCVDLVMYAPGGSAWLSGLELDFPPGWYISTLNVTSIPEGCEPGEGEWVYLDTLDCAPHHFGPGFYFDRNNEGSGMPDGNFCNNYGDECALFPSNMTFCFEMQVAGDCPTDQENLFPYIRLISDAYFGDFPPVCPLPIYIQPDLPGLSLNCCGPGASGPDTVALCESQCLYDLLENAPGGGSWTGPEGYEDVQYCGYFDMANDIPGDYTYHYEEAMCFLSATITVTDSILDIMPVIPFCGEENRDLHASIYEVAIPQDAIWYNPAGEVVADGIAEASTDGLGIYECHFLSETGCLLILEVNYTGLLVAGVEVSTVICESNELFCLGEVFQLLQPPGIEVTGYGNWIVYDHEDNFLDYIPEWDQCLSYEYLESHGSNELVFVYILGAPPCSSQLTPFNVYLSPGAQIEAIVDTVCIGPVDLASYLPQGLPQEGQWLNGDINISPILLPENYAPNTILNLTYTGNQDSDCPFSIPVSITILESQQNLIESTHNYCGDGSVLDLSDLVPDFIGGGLFSPSQEVVLLPQNAGTYTYSISPTGCIGPLYAFNLTISDSLHYSDLTTTLTEDGTGYTVSFTITGGEPPYLVDGSLLSGDSFTSSILSVGTDYAFTLSDSGLCQDIIITGSFVETCIVNAGESPGEIAHCQPEPFCLFDQLTNADAGGAWYGPPGWTDAGCGLVDPSAHPPGNYFYIVSEGTECVDTSLVTLLPIELGVVHTTVYCSESETSLYQWGVSEEEGFWMAPGYPQILDTIPNGMINPDEHTSGVYTYVYYDDNSCLTTVGIDLHFEPPYTGNTDIEPATVCADETSFSPAEAIGLYPPQVAMGDWIIWDSTGTIFLEYLPEWDVTLTGEYLQNLGASLVFTYILGAPPCAPFFMDLPVFVSGGLIEIADSICQGEGSVNLFIFLPPTAPPGGIWTDQNGAVTIGIIDLSSYEAGSVQIFYYTGFSGSGCLETIELSLTILESADAGDDYFMDFCGSGEQIDLYALLPEDVDPGGTFPESPIAASPANSGSYTYLLSSASCGEDSAVYTLTFTEQLSASVTSVCNVGGTTFSGSIEISGGAPPYLVNGEVIEGNSFEPVDMAVADGEVVFVVEDNGPCEAIEIVIWVDDTDGDGICDDQEITGCMDPAASNYNPNATDPGNCMYGIGEPMSHASTWVDESEYGKPASDTDRQPESSPREELNMLIFPNPATDEVSLQFHGLSDTDATIEITDILGSVRYREVLASANGTTFMKVDLRSYASGIYLIRLIHAEKDIVQKIIIAK